MKSGQKPAQSIRGVQNTTLFQEGPIFVEYSYNYPIDELQAVIIHRIKNNKESEEIQERLSELEERLENANTIIEERSIKDAMEKLEEKLRSIHSGEYLQKFRRETDPLVKEYLAFGPISEKVSFMSETAEELTEKVINLDERTARISDTVDRYLRIVSRYVDVEVSRKINTDVNECPGCGYNMTEVYTNESGEQTCPECRTITYKFNLSGHKGIRSFTGSRLYDVQVTFRRELSQFVARERVHIPDEVYTLLDERFQSLGMPPAAEIRQMTPDEYGIMPGTSRALLDDGLQSIGYPSLYKHSRLIGKNLWGWVIQDLSEITPQILKDFSLLQSHYNVIDKGNRKSNTCSQARLLQHLRYRDVKVHAGLFKLPGVQSLIANEIIFKQLCLAAGMEYKPLFPNLEETTKESGVTLVMGGTNVFLSGDNTE